MHKSTIFLIYLGFLSALTPVYAQQDSLEQVVTTLKDSAKVEAMISLAGVYRRNNLKQSISYYDSIIHYAQQIGYHLGEIKALHNKGIANGIMGNYPESISIFNEVVEKSKSIGDRDHESAAYGGLGIVYKRIGDYPSSLGYYQKQLKLKELNNDQLGKANVYSNLGVLYDLMKEPEQSLAYYEKSYSIYDSLDNESGRKTVNNNIGVLYFGNKEYAKALEKMREATRFDIQADNKPNISADYSNLGLCFMHLNVYDSAEYYLNKSLVIANELDLKQEIANSYHNLAELMMNKGQLKKAVEYSEKNIETAYDLQDLHLKKEAYELAVQIQRKNNNPIQALKYYDKFIVYKDSIFNEDKVSEFEKKEVQFNVYKKDAALAEKKLELDLLETRIALESKLKWALAVLLVLVAAILFLIYRRYVSKLRINKILVDKNDLISKQKEEIEASNREIEKRLLRAQMNPHFIFNSLNSIQHFIISNDRKMAMTYLKKFSNLLRQVLEGSINLNVLLEEEIKLLTYYIELEALRFDNEFTYSIEVNENLDVNAYEVPVLLVQPYIENAIGHGLMPQKGEKQLNVFFSEEEKYITCTIKDNGIGREAAAKLKAKKNLNKSRGMSVTERRLEMLKKTQDIETLVHIKDLLDKDGNPCGTEVFIQIPKTISK